MGISYIIKNRKGIRGIRIAVHIDGSVVVTKSVRTPKILAHAFVKTKADWIQEKIKELEKKPKKILGHLNIKDFKENKQKAYALVHNKVLYFNKFYNFEIKSINIRNQKTRWGSCSKDKNINFNYKIVFLPSLFQDYIIVHELCHLREMNHSKRFWNLVAQQIPDHKKRRIEIKKY